MGEEVFNVMKCVRYWVIAVTALVIFPFSTAALAQNIDLAAGGADQVWHGVSAGSNAARWLDQGPLSPGDNRRDLVIGAPGSPSLAGKVHVLFAGPLPSGDPSLALANVTITGPGAGDEFGLATAVGPINVSDSNLTSNLVVGAPGALGGRGAVYLFATPLNNGAMTSANAIYVIRGQPGDRIGAALATADINNDGYREIVIGAPGNNRVYVVAGGPTLNGTRDLAVTPADLVINGAGIGNYLQAGDVTGDGIFEIIIGSPVQNQTYLLTGGYPAVSNLPADADVVFSGIDPGDASGASLRIADLDADGRRDIVIGAPGADGPGNGRPNGGEAYVIWGRSTHTSMSLANADVIFYGAGPGHSLGEGLSAGDINRDTPNDLVMLMSGASAGGELYVFYGRARTGFGTDVGGGRRVVDFASFAPSRRIIGDPAAGRIVTSQVYEVTGEGARDVIVGVPAHDGNRGAAYFAISPRLILNPGSLAASVPQGAEGNRALVLENPSVIPITWSVSSNRPWLAPWPNTGTSVSGAPGSLTIYMSAVGLAPGTYNGTLTFVSTSEHLEMSRTVDVALTVIPPPPPTPGAKIDFSGDGKMDLLFRHSGTGDIISWAMDGANRIAVNWLTPANRETNWRVVGTGDFNADNKPDIVWQEQTAGHLSIWFMNGNVRQSAGTFSTPQVADLGWKIVAVADINNDTRPDLIWREENTGSLAAWLMSGTTVQSVVSLNPGAVDLIWTIVGSGDFNGDGKTDLLWQNYKGGFLAVWYMDGVNRVNAVSLNPGAVVDADWHISATGDLNGDGKVDIVFQHTDGRLVAWFMNGITRSSWSMLNPDHVVDTAWRIVGPR